MFRRQCPKTASVGRLILLRFRFDKRPLAMSIASLSAESSRPPGGVGAAGGSEADPGGGGDDGSGAGGGDDGAAGKFTEEEMAVHRAHRAACEV